MRKTTLLAVLALWGLPAFASVDTDGDGLSDDAEPPTDPTRPSLTPMATACRMATS